MVECKTDGKCVIRVMSDGTTFTGKMADDYTKGNERERELLIIGWNEAMVQTEAEIEKLRAALKMIAETYNKPTTSKDGLAFIAAAALKETGGD